MVTREEVAREK